ncbi:LOW QUALITY PROTEIN: ribonuclease 7-like [Meles meles]|uniref:LOW QUALITY PROTEIN: ribonuclease 7-like n=1 Tax=Meles meles TaxID=9662 RepID=UPI001E69B456|nr:LOW QUALITY PROTEIN: ribonuclease 7-like [Meles meles]
MAAIRTGSCPLLLPLLLWLWVPKGPVRAKPSNVTSALWFEIQHVQPRPQGGNTAMGKVNKYTKHCKPFNTFLHQTFSSVTATCHTPTAACKKGRRNCHQSKNRVSLSTCELTSRKYPVCKHQERRGAPRLLLNIVACVPPEKGDSRKFKLVPVHLDKTL